MRIAEVLTASTGGIGRHVASLAPRLAQQGHEVRVFCPPSTAAAHDFGAVEVLPLTQLYRAREADVLHAHGYKAGVLALPAARTWGIPLVVTWHNAVLGSGPQATAGRLLQSLVARGADLTLGASRDLVAEAQARGARRAVLGPVAAPRLPPPRRTREQVRGELGIGPDDTLVVTVGRLAPQKNLGLVLDIAAALRDLRQLHFVIAGDGPLHAELDARVQLDRSQVQLVGRWTEVASLLAAADVVLLTSTWEARALVAQEALSAGVPLVSSRVGGIEELVGNAAVLFDPQDGPAAADALRQLVLDPARLARLRVAGRERVADWPDEDEVAASLLEVYAGLVSEAAAGHSTRRRRRT